MTFPAVLRRLDWRLVCGLTAAGLLRPLASVVGLSDALGKTATSLVLTAAITLAWVLIVGLRQVREPVATLVAAGLGYAVAVLVLSAVLSPILTGQLQGPLATPAAIIPLLFTNAIWGLVAGGLALLIQRRRAPRHRTGSEPH